jgi:hypothetical protein
MPKNLVSFNAAINGVLCSRALKYGVRAASKLSKKAMLFKAPANHFGTSQRAH